MNDVAFSTFFINFFMVKSLILFFRDYRNNISGCRRRTGCVIIKKEMINITSSIAIDEKEIREEFIRSSGPGGQNVNKVATAVQLRFDVANSSSLPGEVKERLLRLAGKKVTEGGILIIDARRFRTQEKNRQDALERLVKLIQKAAQKPKVRHKTKPTAASQQRRVEEKRNRSKIKLMRRKLSSSDDY
jgi:ribosome-associated protein